MLFSLSRSQHTLRLMSLQSHTQHNMSRSLHNALIQRFVSQYRGWKLNNLTSVIPYSLGVPSNYSLLTISRQS